MKKRLMSLLIISVLTLGAFITFVGCSSNDDYDPVASEVARLSNQLNEAREVEVARSAVITGLREQLTALNTAETAVTTLRNNRLPAATHALTTAQNNARNAYQTAQTALTNANASITRTELDLELVNIEADGVGLLRIELRTRYTAAANAARTATTAVQTATTALTNAENTLYDAQAEYAAIQTPQRRAAVTAATTARNNAETALTQAGVAAETASQARDDARADLNLAMGYTRAQLITWLEARKTSLEASIPGLTTARNDARTAYEQSTGARADARTSAEVFVNANITRVLVQEEGLADRWNYTRNLFASPSTRPNETARAVLTTTALGNAINNSVNAMIVAETNLTAGLADAGITGLNANINAAGVVTFTPAAPSASQLATAYATALSRLSNAYFSATTDAVRNTARVALDHALLAGDFTAHIAWLLGRIENAEQVLENNLNAFLAASNDALTGAEAHLISLLPGNTISVAAVEAERNRINVLINAAYMQLDIAAQNTARIQAALNAIFDREVGYTFVENVNWQAIANQPIPAGQRYSRFQQFTRVPLSPQRVIVGCHGILDIMKTLGLQNYVVGISYITATPDLDEVFPQSGPGALTNINAHEPHTPNFETVMRLRPDLIIASPRMAAGGARNGHISRLNYIAPTIFITARTGGDEYISGLIDSVHTLGQIFQVGDVAAGLVNNLQSRIAATNALAASLNANALIVQLNVQTVALFGASGRYSFIHREFGVGEALLQDTAASHTVANNANPHGTDVGPGFFAGVDADIIFVVDRGSMTDGVPSPVILETHTLFRNLSAVQNNLVIPLSCPSWYMVIGGLNATIYQVEVVYNALRQLQAVRAGS
ncbi:MAG: ABC transporter substrate-binding protein [Firmicutes bacterium]|nr:ABC transporter substrate-binding protein [Bacillota bacterium]